MTTDRGGPRFLRRGGATNPAERLALAHAPHLRAALDGRDARDLAGVVLAQDLHAVKVGAAFYVIPGLRVLKSGVALGVVDRAVARELALALDERELAEALTIPAAPGFLRVLTLTASLFGVVSLGFAGAQGPT